MRALTLATALPLALLCAAIGLVARHAWRLLAVAPLDARAFAIDLERRIAQQDHAHALLLAQRLLPAWGAGVAAEALRAHARGERVQILLDELLSDLRDRQSGEFFVLRSLARMALPLSIAVAIVALGAGFTGDQGLLALQKGLAESIAVERAVFAIATGFATAVVCQLGVRFVHRQSRRLLEDLQRITNVLRQLDAESPAPGTPDMRTEM